MTFEFRPARSRLVAKTMLLVWLLAFAVGAANGCLLRDRDTLHDEQVPWLPTTTAGAMRAPAGAGVGDREHTVVKEACKSLCNDVASAIAKAKPWQAEQSPTPVAVVPWFVLPLTPASALAHAAALPLPAGPPVPILFRRLTI